MNCRLVIICCLTLSWMAPLALAEDAAPSEPIDFAHDVRPILSDKCFRCHGPDVKSRQADLRLDEEEAAKEYAIIPGDADGSEFVVRIESTDEDTMMPPPDSGKTLTPEERALLRRWIDEGAAYEAHWSLVPPVRPELPETTTDRDDLNEIDHFVIARLAREGWSLQPVADRATLLRRVTFDLTGLPPTMAELDAFLADQSPDAYEKVVDRLLKSPHYGEHMARFWLDAARYGDTHGLHLDNYREMWPYRDWVVRAFNRNLPYDQFVTEQLAGDLLADPTLDQLIATGFNRCHVTTNEGGSIEEEVYVRNVVDQTVTFSTVFMGLTFECTRCHDHKYDPLTMKDFYSLYAFFNSLDGSPMDGNRKDPAPVVSVPTDAQRDRLAEIERELTELTAKLAGPLDVADQQQAAWEARLLDPNSVESIPLPELDAWYVVGPFSGDRQALANQKQGPEGKDINLEETFQENDASLAWQRRDDWQDGKVHADVTGDSAASFLYRKIHSTEPQEVTASLGSDDGLKLYLNGELLLANDVSRGAAADQEKVTMKLVAGDNHLLLKIMNYGGASGFYFQIEQGAHVPADILALVRTPVDQRQDDQIAKLRTYFRDRLADDPALNAARQRQQELTEQRKQVNDQIATTMIFRERQELKPAFVLRRGEYDQPTDEVTRRTPLALPPMTSDMPVDRLGLAQWLLDRSHPLTARVAVNRFWQQFFGVGLVKTTEDFGSQGESPSHPLLLDWLAVQFMEDGWDVQQTLKRIVMSATYRQASQSSESQRRKDPANRLFWRGPRYRLDAEMLRDQALQVSGLLVDQVGGPSVKPPQPDGLWFAVGYSGSNTVRFRRDEGRDKVHRRTLYTFIKRTSPPPQMSTFDSPSRESCVVRRERTNTPLQALLLMNDPQYVEAARALAERTMRDVPSDRGLRAAHMFRLCAMRLPNEAELQDLLRAYEDQYRMYCASPDSAKELIKIGEEAPDPSRDPAELAAWTMVANLMLNLDEVVSKN